MKAATGELFMMVGKTRISIHAAREGGDSQGRANQTNCPISIHAAREGGDGSGQSQKLAIGISIHAAREGGDGGNV